MLLEVQVSTNEWPHVLLVVQANMNQSPIESLGNVSLMGLFMFLDYCAATLE